MLLLLFMFQINNAMKLNKINKNLIDAIKKNSPIEVYTCLSLNADPNYSNKETSIWTSLMEACSQPHPNKNIIKILLENGANPNLQDDQGRTPLHMIAQNRLQIGDFTSFILADLENSPKIREIAELLLLYKADPTIKDSFGREALTSGQKSAINIEKQKTSISHTNKKKQHTKSCRTCSLSENIVICIDCQILIR